MSDEARPVAVRPTRPEDLPAIIELSRLCYPEDIPWTLGELAGHRAIFPEGQLVAVEAGEAIVGAAASLIVSWEEYDVADSWRDFTDHGRFTNHDPDGRTLYGAEVMVDPRARRRGVGSALYRARERLVERLGLARIRAGARLRHYARHADRLGARDYVDRVVAGEMIDPTLSFQLRRGFRVLAVVEDYLERDPESRGWAAVVEWVPGGSGVPVTG